MIELENSTDLLKKRFAELANRSEKNSIYTETEFLTPSEQLLLKQSRISIPYYFFGGYEYAEKMKCIFGSEETCGYEYVPDVSYLRIEPLSDRFSEVLGHRDYLGSIMALGINRNRLGDLIVKDNKAYLIGESDMIDYILQNLKEVRHTQVRSVALQNYPNDVLPVLENVSFVVTSVRMDSVIAAVFKQSRSVSKQLVENDRVLVNGSPVSKSDFEPSAGDIVTVKGFGKFIFRGFQSDTKKGRMRLSADMFH